MFKIKNWGTHQPKMRTDRNVIWIKVYKRLLEDYDYQILTDSNRATLIELWLLGAENNGILPDVKEIAFRLRREKSFINKQLEELSSFVCQDVSESLPRNKKNVSLDVDVDVEVKKPNIIINAKADVVKKKSEYFDKWWIALPVNRKNNKKGCEQKWGNKNLDSIGKDIMQWTTKMKGTKEWREGFNPSPETILNQERWNDISNNTTDIKGVL
jgi:hypothetical protein|tara:strand:+ start:1302 stop:1940 length:639 start_codon:yes stop_codon:yes gene_type:complete